MIQDMIQEMKGSKKCEVTWEIKRIQEVESDVGVKRIQEIGNETDKLAQRNGSSGTVMRLQPRSSNARRSRFSTDKWLRVPDGQATRT